MKSILLILFLPFWLATSSPPRPASSPTLPSNRTRMVGFAYYRLYSRLDWYMIADTVDHYTVSTDYGNATFLRDGVYGDTGNYHLLYEGTGKAPSGQRPSLTYFRKSDAVTITTNDCSSNCFLNKPDPAADMCLYCTF